MKFGKLQPQGKVEFDGYQELMNWTSAGSESSVALTVDGDTDMEYVIECRNLKVASNSGLYCRLNNDSTANIFGFQYIFNSAGTITAARGTTNLGFFVSTQGGYGAVKVSTIDGFLKFSQQQIGECSSGTDVTKLFLTGFSYNSTYNITSLDFLIESGNFTAGTNIRVLGRRAR
jgi:hypothetical protein